MFDNKKSHASVDRLDRVGREIIRASASNEAEAEAAAASPFLYARLRSRINAERGQREERERWLMTLKVVWRAIPAMALVAVMAFVLFLTANFGTLPTSVSGDVGILDAQDAGVEGVVFADARSVSSDDDVLATILNEDVQEASR
jgi:anti-sigma-K factor RskA